MGYNGWLAGDWLGGYNGRLIKENFLKCCSLGGGKDTYTVLEEDPDEV